MNLLKKIQYNQYWNIGFCEQTPDELIRGKELRPIQWLKHPYRDRWFADPFILKVTDSEIVVFVEECTIDNPKGIICELVIDRKTMSLKERHVILEKDTHLSYPAIIRQNGKVYVYPENGASGRLYLYEYDEVNHKLINPVCILVEAVADATILSYGADYYLCATKYPETQIMVYLYKSSSIEGPYTPCENKPFNGSLRSSRSAGNWITIDGRIYRPAQDCSERYGAAMTIMSVLNIEPYMQEDEYCHIEPVKGRYNLGIHTMNFQDGVCVIDGYGHYNPLLGRLYYCSFIHRLIDLIKR